jgi:ATP-binding cassette subfamily C protein LapB
MVLVTHKMQLLALVQRVLVMANGRIVMDGPTKDVAARLTQSASAPAASGPTGAAAAAAATV